MNDRNQESREPPAQRLTECEIMLTHLQRAIEELNGVVLEQSKRMESLEQKLEKLAGILGALAAPEAEERRPEDEKPPHY